MGVLSRPVEGQVALLESCNPLHRGKRLGSDGAFGGVSMRSPGMWNSDQFGQELKSGNATSDSAFQIRQLAHTAEQVPDSRPHSSAIHERQLQPDTGRAWFQPAGSPVHAGRFV